MGRRGREYSGNILMSFSMTLATSGSLMYCMAALGLDIIVSIAFITLGCVGCVGVGVRVCMRVGVISLCRYCAPVEFCTARPVRVYRCVHLRV